MAVTITGSLWGKKATAVGRIMVTSPLKRTKHTYVFFLSRLHTGRGVGGEGWDPYLDCTNMENTRIKPP